MTKKSMIPSTLFNLEPSWEPQAQSAAPVVGQKRGGSFRLNLPNFSPGSTEDCATETIRKALSVLSNSQVSVLSNDKNWKDTTHKLSSDALSVSTASTVSLREEESDIEIDQEDEVPITSLPPDALFIIEGKEFPCHTQLLSQQASPLLDLLSRNGLIERKTKRQRTSSSLREQSQGHDELKPWSSPSGITVARLSKDVNPDFFEVLMEFLYTNEIRIKLPDNFHEDDQQDDPWLMGNEDLVDDYEWDEDDDEHLPNFSDEGEESTPTGMTPLKFLQGSFSLADRFACTSLKTAIEHKIYDEFLFSFTAKELVAWADENNCAFLRQKAVDKLP